MNPTEYTYYIIGATVWRFPEGSDSGEVSCVGFKEWFPSSTSRELDFKAEKIQPVPEWEVAFLLGGEI